MQPMPESLLPAGTGGGLGAVIIAPLAGSINRSGEKSVAEPHPVNIVPNARTV